MCNQSNACQASSGDQDIGLCRHPPEAHALKPQGYHTRYSLIGSQPYRNSATVSAPFASLLYRTRPPSARGGGRACFAVGSGGKMPPIVVVSFDTGKQAVNRSALPFQTSRLRTFGIRPCGVYGFLHKYLDEVAFLSRIPSSSERRLGN